MSETITTMQMKERLGISKNQAYHIVNRPDFYPAVRTPMGWEIDCDKMAQWVEEKNRKKEEKIIKPIERQRLSLCWECANYNGGCSWSVDFTPVVGWEAEYKPIKIFRGHLIDSYFVRKCPEFKAEERRQRKK